MKLPKSIIIIVSIDTECDKGARWEVQHPIRYTSVTEGIPRELTPLFEEFGIVPTYLLSPEIIRDLECVNVLSEIRNCELGAHLHGEFLIDNNGSSVNRTSTPQCLYNSEIEFNLLKKLTSSFKDAFGFQPKSFRAGRFGISKHTIGFLEELGYLVDSSVTPFRKVNFSGGSQVNFWGAPYSPYFPSHNNVARQGNSTILEVPVSTIIPSIANYPLPIQRFLGQNQKFYKRMVKRIARSSSYSNDLVWIRPFRDTPEGLINSAEQIIRLWRSEYPPVINIMFHSVEVIANASPYAKDETDVQTLLLSLRSLFDHLCSNYDCRPLGLSSMPKFN